MSARKIRIILIMNPSITIPTVISLIFTPPGSYDVKDENEALDEAADSDEVRNGEEG
jgi:hypothetical protein